MIKFIASAGVALGAMIAANAALAADIEAKSKIDAVTVFPDAAIVTRIMEVDLPAGASTLVLSALPPTIDPASLRVEGRATGRLLLGAAESRLRPADPQKTVSENEAQLKSLREQLAQSAAALDALEGRKQMVQRYAQTGPVKDDKSGTIDVAQWSTAWAAVGDALTKVNDEILKGQRTRADIELKIRSIEASETARRSRIAPEREFTVAVETEAPLKGQLTVSYRVISAGWQPAYDARLETDGKAAGSMTLARRALVTQRTGEDWSDAEITLSTVRAARGTAAPEVNPQRAAFWEVPPPPMPAAVAAPSVRMRMAAEESQRAAPGAADLAAGAQAYLKRAEAPQASLESNGFQATYRLPGRLTVPTDGSQKSVLIQSRDIKPELLVKAAPALDPTAYLEAAFTNDEDAPLLAGTVNLIRDNMFVGRGQLAFTAPGDKVSLGFGADDRVKVQRIPVRRRETDPAQAGATKTDTRDFKITIKNLHDFPIKTSVIDQIPFSEISTLTVEPLPTNTPPTEKLVQDRRGVMGWTYDLKPKDEKEIRLGYRMRWPSDREVIFQPAPTR